MVYKDLEKRRLRNRESYWRNHEKRLEIQRRYRLSRKELNIPKLRVCTKVKLTDEEKKIRRQIYYQKNAGVICLKQKLKRQQNRKDKKLYTKLQPVEEMELLAALSLILNTKDYGK